MKYYLEAVYKEELLRYTVFKSDESYDPGHDYWVADFQAKNDAVSYCDWMNGKET